MRVHFAALQQHIASMRSKIAEMKVIKNSILILIRSVYAIESFLFGFLSTSSSPIPTKVTSTVHGSQIPCLNFFCPFQIFCVSLQRDLN